MDFGEKKRQSKINLLKQALLYYITQVLFVKLKK